MTAKTLPPLLLLLLLFLALPGLAGAGVPITPDVDVQILGSDVADEDVVDGSFTGTGALIGLGPLDGAVAIDAYSGTASGDHLFSTETTTVLSTGLTVRPGDVVRWDGATYTIVYGTAGAALNVDAVLETAGTLVVSFDTSVDLGGGVVAADEDLVDVGPATPVLFFDASAAGVDPALDLDGAAAGPGGSLWLSFDQAGSVGGLDFDDDTVLEYAAPDWFYVFDASDDHPGTEAADVVAVPEPGVTLGLVCGSAMLLGLGRRRAR